MQRDPARLLAVRARRLRGAVRPRLGDRRDARRRAHGRALGRRGADLPAPPRHLVDQLRLPLLRHAPLRRRRPLDQRLLALAALVRRVLAPQPPRVPALGRARTALVGDRPDGVDGARDEEDAAGLERGRDHARAPAPEARRASYRYSSNLHVRAGTCRQRTAPQRRAAAGDPRRPAPRREGRGRASSCGELGVSEDTIRRDLRELAAQGLVQRVHGGALAPAPQPGSFTHRRETSERREGGAREAGGRRCSPAPASCCSTARRRTSSSRAACPPASPSRC